MRDQGGRIKALTVSGVDRKTMRNTVKSYVEVGSEIHTDEHSGYDLLEDEYKRSKVTHGKGEFSVDGVTTNAIESVWAVLRRGLYGVYHSVSNKHLDLYLNEFAFRLHDGSVKKHTYDRLNSLYDNCVGVRVTYKELTSEKRSHAGRVG